MAANGGSEMDTRSHRQTYGLFTGLIKWGTIISFILAAIVVLIIAS